MTVHSLSVTFLGFSEASSTMQTVTLSTTAETIVDTSIYFPATLSDSGAALPPVAFAVGGGFRVLDPSTGDASSIGALVVQNTVDQSTPRQWITRLVFPPQASSVQVWVQSVAVFALYSGGAP